MWQAPATPCGKTFLKVQRESACGYCNPSLLEGAFPEEVHGHGVTLAPFGVVMCANAWALPKQAQAMAARLLGRITRFSPSSWCWGNVGKGVWLSHLSIDSTREKIFRKDTYPDERKSFRKDTYPVTYQGGAK